MDNDVCSVLDRTTEYGCGECIVNDKRNIVLVCYLGKLLYVEYCECRICKSFTENSLSIRLECRSDLILSRIGINEDTLDAKLLECYGKEIYRTAIDSCSRNEAVACLTDIEDGAE